MPFSNWREPHLIQGVIYGSLSKIQFNLQFAQIQG